MNQKPMGALHLIDDAANLVGFPDRQQLFLPPRGNERQHHHVGVGIQEDILDEPFRAPEAGPPEPVLAHEMALYVEHELAAPEPLERDARVDRRHLFQLEKSAGSAGSRVCRVEGQQRTCGTAGGNHECSAADSTPLGIFARKFLCQSVRPPIRGVEGDRHELAVGRRIQFDGEARSLGI
jgi:hypothetical protein